MSTPFATGSHNRGWLPDPPPEQLYSRPHLVVQCFATVDFLLDSAVRRAALTNYLWRVAGKTLELPPGRIFTLGPLRYVAGIVAYDLETLYIPHPLQGSRATEADIEELAAKLRDNPVDNGSWVVVVHTYVILGGSG